MAFSRINYTGNGTAVNYTFPFPYLDKTDIYVYVAGVAVPFTFLNTSTVTCNVVPAAGSSVQVRRSTQKTSVPVNFTDGSVLLEKDLDLLASYTLFSAQESEDIAASALRTGLTSDFDAVGQRLTNLAAGVLSTDAVNKGQLDAPLATNVATVTALKASAETAALSATLDAAAAHGSLVEFKGRNYGPLSADPTVNPFGSPLAVGDEYFNTTTGTKRVYRISGWLDFETVAKAKAGEAAISASASEVSRVAAGVSSGLAAAAKTAAEAARDASSLNGKVYASTAAGVAAVASGSYFSVPSAESSEYLILYLNNAGMALEQKRYPSTTRITAIESNVSALQLDTAAIKKSLGGYEINAGEVAISAAALSSDASKVAEYRLAEKSLMFTDLAGTLPVGASGDLVAIIDPKNVRHGDEIISNNNFTSAVGWTLDPAWSIAGGKAFATAATGHHLRWITTLIDQRRYVVELAVVISAGTLQIDMGGSGTNLQLTATGRYKFRLPCGGAPTAGIFFRTTGFTGSISYASLKEESVWSLIAPSLGERGTYQVDANGIPYLSAPVGKCYKTTVGHTFAVPFYMAAGLSCDATVTAPVFSFSGTPYAAGMAFTAGAYSYQVGSVRSGIGASPDSRPGSLSLRIPAVVDLLVLPGSTSAWCNGGEREVPDDVALAAGELRTVANTFTGAELQTGSNFGINFGANATGGSCSFYGGFVYLGKPTITQRRMVTRTLMMDCGLTFLEDDSYDIFAIAGQSNAMGVGSQETSTRPAFGTAIEYLDSGNIKPLADPTQHCYPNNTASTGSAWPAFGKRYYETSNRRACIVGSAFSGEGLINPSVVGGWLGPTLIPRLVRKLATARIDVRGQVRGVIYIGGENDVTSEFTLAQYKGYLVQFRDRLRLETGISYLPLLIMSLDNLSTASAKYALMRQAQAEAAAENEGIHLIMPYQGYTAAGYSADTIHWNQTALNDAGGIGANGVAAALADLDGYMNLSAKPSTTATSGVALAVQPVVSVLSSKGVVIAGFTGNVTASLVGTGTLGGTLTRTAVAGVATFTDLSITGAGVSNLRFTSLLKGDVLSLPVTTA